MLKQYYSFLRLSIFICALFLGISQKALSQTTLAIGDISIVGFNSATPDGFSFVTWVPLASGTVIKFTDNGFLGAVSANATLNGRGGENFVTFTTNTAIAAGTVISLVNTAVATTTPSSGGTAVLALSGLSGSGDQIFAYQGAGDGTTASTSDFGTNMNPSTFTGVILFGLNFKSAWFTTGIPNTNTSYLPSELNVTNGNIVFLDTIVAAQYTSTFSGTVAALKASVANPANWTSYAANTALNVTAFTITTGTIAAPTATATTAIAQIDFTANWNAVTSATSCR